MRPKLIVAGACAYPRIIDFERMAAIAHGVGALLFVDMAHIAGLVAAGLHPSPFPHADLVTTTTHKTLRGPRGGLIFSRVEFPEDLDKADFPTVKGTLAAAVDKTVFPGIQGGPLMHVIAAKAVALLLALGEDFRADQHRTVENAAILAETLARAGRTARVRRHGQPPHARRRDAPRGDRQGGRGEPRRGRHHRQQERHPLRPAAAQHGIRHPGRHARHDDPRLRAGRDAPDRRRSSCVPSRPATTRLPRRCWRPRCARSATGSPCRACPRRDPGRRRGAPDHRRRLRFGAADLAAADPAGGPVRHRDRGHRCARRRPPRPRPAHPARRRGGGGGQLRRRRGRVLRRRGARRVHASTWTTSPRRRRVALFGGAVAAAVLGFLDDRFQLRARWQLLDAGRAGGRRRGGGCARRLRLQPGRRRRHPLLRPRSRSASPSSGSSA